ncbi:MAG: NAD-dependent epimerase/dehydratase family protein, partial [Geminicoccaceae bacterium]|nr:NAD-dependent epimerase/dehydratase family protein [Geminicoccaceae bacterium]
MAVGRAVIVGGLGVIGRNLLHHLEQQGGWEVVGLSRRAPDFVTEASFIQVDLLDREQTFERLRNIGDATHVFYCAFQA